MAMRSRSCRPSAAAEAVLLTEEPLSLEAAVRRFASRKDGAVVSFSGTVRDSEGGAPLRAITYEAYEGMALKELRRIAREAEERWGVRVAVQHRTGRVAAGEASLVVASHGAHRGEAFAACQFVVEQIKARAAIWKVGYEYEGAAR